MGRPRWPSSSRPGSALPDPEAVLTAVYTGELEYGRLFELAEVCLVAAAAGDRPATEAAQTLADEVTALAAAAVTPAGGRGR